MIGMNIIKILKLAAEFEENPAYEVPPENVEVLEAEPDFFAMPASVLKEAVIALGILKKELQTKLRHIEDSFGKDISVGNIRARDVTKDEMEQILDAQDAIWGHLDAIEKLDEVFTAAIKSGKDTIKLTGSSSGATIPETPL
jgi:hypothetical protein